MHRGAAPGNGAEGTRGYSLSEMLTVIALMALLILFGGPALADAYRAYKVRTVADGLSSDIRALRYGAVTTRATRTMTIHDQSDSVTPNQYSFVNTLGKTVVRTLEPGVNIETGSATSISFGNTGATGVTSNLSVQVSMDINATRGARYTVTVTPTGTVSTTFASYTP